MATFSAQEQEQILAAFQRRRTLELLISIPILSGVFVLVLLFRNPSYQIAGYGGQELAIAAGAVLAVGLGLHFINWRCPVCRRPLPRGVAGSPFCRGCGAVFVAKGAKSETLKQGAPAEVALERELGLYRLRGAKTLIAGLVLLPIGVWLTVFFSAGGQGPRNDLWLYRTYGEQGLVWGGRGIGVLLTLLVAWLLYRAQRRLTVGVRAREANSRRVLGLPAAGNAPPPSRAGFLAGLLAVVLVVAALYLLSQRL